MLVEVKRVAVKLGVSELVARVDASAIVTAPLGAATVEAEEVVCAGGDRGLVWTTIGMDT